MTAATVPMHTSATRATMNFILSVSGTSAKKEETESDYKQQYYNQCNAQSKAGKESS